MQFRRFFASVTLALLLVPFFAEAKDVRSLINTSAPTVSRAQFLSWLVTALEIPKGDGNCTLPYTRAPKALRGTLCAAELQGALSVFGQRKQYTLGQRITRGEALLVLTAFLDRSEKADISAFKDVKGKKAEQAVMNAVALRWTSPVRGTHFGMAQPLTGSEALSILENALGEAAGVQNFSVTINGETKSFGNLPKEELIGAVWELLNRDYIKNGSISEEEAAYAAIEGMVNSLKDPYTSFFRPAGAANFQQQLKGELTGIGAHIDDKGGVITVVTPLPGSPAERAGILPGDELIEANGVNLVGIGVDKAVSFIRGERGTTVELKVRRSGMEITVKVVRDLILIPEISVSFQGDVAIVQLMQFGEITLKTIRPMMEDIVKKNPRGIILDLRNNGGGLLSAADIVMSNFVPKGTIFAKVQSRAETREEKTNDEPTVPAGIKMVVLVNKGSASASELVAGALQDHKRATVIGTKSFGKGTVQQVTSFSSGEAIKITVAEWQTPLGRKIDGIGVEPDIVVEEDKDAQMKRAVEHILR